MARGSWLAALNIGIVVARGSEYMGIVAAQNIGDSCGSGLEVNNDVFIQTR